MRSKANPFGIHGRRSCRVGPVLVITAALLMACGGSLTDEEILAASGVQTGVSTGPSSVDGQPAGTSPGDGSTAAGVLTSGTGLGQAADGSPALPPGSDTGSGGATSTGGPAVGTPGETGPIVLGSVGNYSGPAGAAQAPVPRGVQIWAASINASGGLFGREVQVIVQDDGGDPARYAAAVQDLVENRGVVAFVGQAASLSMQGGASYLEQAGVPVIGTDCSVRGWYDSSVFFPQCPTLETAVRGVPLLAVQLLGLRKFGYVFCGEAESCTTQDSLLPGLTQEAGAELVYRAQISLTQIDFTAECRNAQAAGVEAMFVAADPNTLSRWVRSCDRQGFRPKYVSVGIAASVDSISLPGLADLVVSTGIFPFAGLSGGVFDEYATAVATFAGEPSSPGLAQGWAAAKLFELAAMTAAQQVQSISSSSLVGALRGVQGETLGGLTVPLDFSTGRANPANCVFVVQGDGQGGWGAPRGAEPVCA